VPNALTYAIVFTFLFAWAPPLRQSGKTSTPAVRLFKLILGPLLFFTAFTCVNLWLAAAAADRESQGFFHLFSLLGGTAALLCLLPTLLLAFRARSILSPSRTALYGAAAFFLAVAVLFILAQFPPLNWW
jgi:hypothetical protein